MSSRLSQRGANANAPAKLPALQAPRVADPQTQKALDALREWVEVRLGSRGDRFEKAVTLRELEQILAPLREVAERLGVFNGEIQSLRSTQYDALPTEVRNGSFIALKSGKLYFGLNGQWREISLVAP